MSYIKSDRFARRKNWFERNIDTIKNVVVYGVLFGLTFGFWLWVMYWGIRFITL
jgi:hypothetical protein